MNPGDWDYLYRGGIFAYAWMDSAHCQILSSFHLPEEGTVRRRVRGEVGRPERRAPTAFIDYNKGMGGNDAGDMLRTRMTSHQKSKKWWKGVFYYILDQSIISTLRVWNDLRLQFPSQDQQQKPWTMIYLLSQLSLMLCEPQTERHIYTLRKTLPVGPDHSANRNRNPEFPLITPSPKRRASSRRAPINFLELESIRDASNHSLIKGNSTGTRCKRCYALGKKNRALNQNKRTLYYCRECDCPFCPTCFDQYHRIP